MWLSAPPTSHAFWACRAGPAWCGSRCELCGRGVGGTRVSGVGGKRALFIACSLMTSHPRSRVTPVYTPTSSCKIAAYRRSVTRTYTLQVVNTSRLAPFDCLFPDGALSEKEIKEDCLFLIGELSDSEIHACVHAHKLANLPLTATHCHSLPLTATHCHSLTLTDTH